MSILPNVRLTSTTYEVEEVKIRRPVRAKGTALSEAKPRRGWRHLARLDWRKPVGVRLSYRHGAHPTVLVEARGSQWVYDWDVPILEVLEDVANRSGYSRTV